MNRTAPETKKRKLIKFLIRLLTLALVVGGIFLLGYYIFSLLGGKTKLREDIQKWTKENTFLGGSLSVEQVKTDENPRPI